MIGLKRRMIILNKLYALLFFTEKTLQGGAEAADVPDQV